MSVSAEPPPRLSRPAHHFPSKGWWAITFGALASLLVASLLWHQAPGHSHWLPPCVFHTFTGLFCTGCGITRAVYALVHGDVLSAWSMNPLAVLALPVAVVLWLDVGLHRPARLQPWLAPLRDARVWAVVVLVFTIGRNLPWAPFAGWAPG